MVTKERHTTRATQVAFGALLLLALAATLPGLLELPARARANAAYLQLNRALSQNERGELERATQGLTVASNSPVVSRRAWRGLGLAYMSVGRLDEASIAWPHVSGGEEEFALWGRQAELLGDWKRAHQWYQLTVRLAPQNGDAWYHLARTSDQLGDGTAADNYRQALVATEHVQFGRSNILTRLGELAKNSTPPEWTTALTHFEAALQQDQFTDADDRQRAQLGRAEALDKLGQTATALAVYREAAANWPGHYWANVHSGRLTWYVERDSARAATYLERAIALDADNKWAYLFLAEIYAESDQPERAIALFGRVLELDPANESARKQLGQLTGGHDS